MVGVDRVERGENETEEVMTKKEKAAFAQGVEEGFVRAAELSGNPDAVLRQFRPVSPTYERAERSATGVTRRERCKSAK